MSAINLFEANLLQMIHNVVSNPILDVIFTYITRMGNHGFFFAVLALVLIILPKTRYHGGVLAFALLLDLVIVNVIMKPLFDRPRPYTILTEIQPILPLPRDASFPSGHTAVAFAAAFAMRNSGRRIFETMVILASLMGVSRIYFMMHYPTDVLAGVIVGGFCGIFSVRLWKKAEEYGKLK